MNKSYGVDISAYQPENLELYRKSGATFAIIKLTEGKSWVSTKAKAQIASSRKNHLYTHGYHFGTFGNSVKLAKIEAKYFLYWANKLGISKKRMLWLDWEESRNNKVTGNKSDNTKAILAFMTMIKNAGYRPGLYSGAQLLRTNIDTAPIIKKFGTCIWVASYPTSEPVSTADFRYFPTMEGVAAWQFTSNWKNLNVDGDIAVVDLNKKG